MITDDTLQELWKIKEDIANEYGYNLTHLVAYLKSKDTSKKSPIILEKAEEVIFTTKE